VNVVNISQQTSFCSAKINLTIQIAKKNFNKIERFLLANC